MNKKKYRKAIFAPTYSKSDDGKIEYIILKRKKHWHGWEFCKGKIEKGETKLQAVKRETIEETGLKPMHIKRFNVKGLFRYKKRLKDRPEIIGQTYTLYSVKVKKPLNNKIKVDTKEHYLGKWVTFEKAVKILSWQDQKRCLKIVDKWLKDK